jgi:DNA-binding beta-propeller fold protein YncE
VDQHGQIFFPDACGNCVKKFSPDGRWLATFESAGSDGAPFNSPRDVAVDDAGNLCVADTNNNRIVGLQPDGELGWLLDRFGLPGGGGEEEEFYEPYSVCLAGGRLWVADTNNNRVLAFDSQRRPLDVQTNGAFVLPSGVRARDAGSVYVADHGNLRVQRFDGAGKRTGLLTITPRLVDNVAVAGGGEMDVTAEGHVVMVNPLRESVAIVAFVGP